MNIRIATPGQIRDYADGHRMIGAYRLFFVGEHIIIGLNDLW